MSGWQIVALVAVVLAWSVLISYITMRKREVTARAVLEHAHQQANELLRLKPFDQEQQ